MRPLLKEVARPGTYTNYTDGDDFELTPEILAQAAKGSNGIIENGYNVRAFPDHEKNDTLSVLGDWTGFSIAPNGSAYGVFVPRNEKSREIIEGMDVSIVMESGVNAQGYTAALAFTRVDVVPQGAIVGMEPFVELARRTKKDQCIEFAGAASGDQKLGNAVRRARLERGLSQQDVADEIERRFKVIHERGTISKVERGDLSPSSRIRGYYEEVLGIKAGGKKPKGDEKMKKKPDAEMMDDDEPEAEMAESIDDEPKKAEMAECSDDEPEAEMAEYEEDDEEEDEDEGKEAEMSTAALAKRVKYLEAQNRKLQLSRMNDTINKLPKAERKAVRELALSVEKDSGKFETAMKVVNAQVAALSRSLPGISGVKKGIRAAARPAKKPESETEKKRKELVKKMFSRMPAGQKK